MKRLILCLLLAGCAGTTEPTRNPEHPPRVVTIPCPTRADPRILFREVYEIPKDGSRYFHKGHWYRVARTGRGTDGWYMELHLDEKETQRLSNKP